MKHLLCGLGLGALISLNGFAASVSLIPVADTTISEDNEARASGSTDTMIVGHLGHGQKARGLLLFDLSGIPAGATVNSATLTIMVTASASGSVDTYGLHRLNVAWSEEAATWVSTGNAAWVGGDFVAAADSTSDLTTGSSTFLSTAALRATVQNWISNPAGNRGWLLRNENEVADRTARRISTREALSDQPSLTIDYTPPPDFSVTSPDFFFAINGQSPNPALTLTRGSNYVFGINTDPVHPFQISSDPTGTPYQNGLSTNNISNGRITFVVPTNAPATLYYLCSTHLFGGTINIVDPPPPPPPPDFTVTTPASYYNINGSEPNPTLTLTRGVTYTFAIDADSSHPFEIVSDLSGTEWSDGVSNNNISQGLLTFAVPLNAPDALYYICSVHFFGGTINIIDPVVPSPPLVQLLSIDLTSSNVVMTSLGTNGNGWLAIPEFSSNLLVSNWAVVPSFTNSYANGTNRTIFNRLDPICGPNVFLRIKNLKN